MYPQPPPYGQPPYGQPPYPQPYPPQPRRSAIPRVVGIIGCVFAPIGIGASALFTFGPLSDIRRWSHEAADLGTVTSWLYAWMALSVVLFGLHLVGSILSIMYRASGPKLLTSYAVGALILIVVDMVMVHGFVPRHAGLDLYGSVTISHSIFSGFAFVWPVVVLALITNKRAREACR